MRLLAFCLLAACSSSLRNTPTTVQETEPLMTRRGQPVLADDFGPESSWGGGRGTAEVKDGILRMQEKPEEKHHAGRGKIVAIADTAVIQFSFRFDGASAKWLGIGIDHVEGGVSEHVFRARANADGFVLQSGNGWGPTTKLVKLVETKKQWEPGRWYTAMIELRGNEVLAQIDGKVVAHVELDAAPDWQRIARPKNRLALISGGEWASFDNLRVWEAHADETWAQRKAGVLAASR